VPWWPISRPITPSSSASKTSRQRNKDDHLIFKLYTVNRQKKTTKLHRTVGNLCLVALHNHPTTCPLTPTTGAPPLLVVVASLLLLVGMATQLAPLSLAFSVALVEKVEMR